MKNKIAIASAFIAASSFSFAEIALTEAFSVKGFVNTLYSDSSGNDAANDAEFDLAEVEISFLFNTGAVSAQVDIDYQNDNDGDLDQAFINFDVFGGTITAGLFDSQLGFEGFEAPDLYTNTLNYGLDGQGAADSGVKYTRQLDAVSSLGVALIDAGSFIGDEDADDTTIEIAYGRDLGNGFNAFVGYRSDENGDAFVNAYVTYDTGAMKYAVEVNEDEDGDNSYQLFANYAYADNASLTVRYTTAENGGDINNGLAPDDDLEILTLAHQLALADNLMLTTEINDNGQNEEEHEFSVSLLFTF